jgi:hypothetical protein
MVKFLVLLRRIYRHLVIWISPENPPVSPFLVKGGSEGGLFSLPFVSRLFETRLFHLEFGFWNLYITHKISLTARKMVHWISVRQKAFLRHPNQ